MKGSSFFFPSSNFPISISRVSRSLETCIPTNFFCEDLDISHLQILPSTNPVTTPPTLSVPRSCMANPGSPKMRALRDLTCSREAKLNAPKKYDTPLLAIREECVSYRKKKKLERPGRMFESWSVRSLVAIEAEPISGGGFRKHPPRRVFLRYMIRWHIPRRSSPKTY